MSKDIEVIDHHPIADPGHEEHIERWADVDKAAGNRAHRQVVGLFAAVPVLAIAFVVIYFLVPRTSTVNFFFLHTTSHHFWLGVTGGLMVLCIGIGAVQWARLLMGDVESVEERHEAGSSAEVRAAAVAALTDGIDQSAVKRRKFLLTSLGGALGIAVVPAVVVLADMGPAPGPGTRAATIEKTIWGEGIKLVTDVTYNPIKASDLEIGELVNAQPENLEALHHDPVAFQRAKAKSSIVIVRMDPNRIKIPESRRDWQVGGILAYSKICTHVGCPINLWEQQTHHLLCPCHQSTYDLGNSGVVVFGPAGRSLPQLPITTDAQGYLIARSDFPVPVGPSYSERDSRNDYKDGDR